MLVSKILQFNCRHKKVYLAVVAHYSRKSNSECSGTYKIVNRGNQDPNGFSGHKLGSNANWELLAPQGFRFYLPGNVGPAWHDQISIAHMPNTMINSDGVELECTVQECPMLLRQGVSELFPSMNANNSCPLTVVTLTQKVMKKTVDQDIELLTKQFMWAAQDICGKLQAAGYWADFINPFSGIPYGSSHNRTTLYKTDERFRCLGFNITQRGGCRLISKKRHNDFVGSLFTTAPACTDLLRDILDGYDCT